MFVLKHNDSCLSTGTGFKFCFLLWLLESASADKIIYVDTSSVDSFETLHLVVLNTNDNNDNMSWRSRDTCCIQTDCLIDVELRQLSLTAALHIVAISPLFRVEGSNHRHRLREALRSSQTICPRVEQLTTAADALSPQSAINNSRPTVGAPQADIFLAFAGGRSIDEWKLTDDTEAARSTDTDAELNASDADE